jgi:methyl-accepting chemotaxis protein PixJ
MANIRISPAMFHASFALTAVMLGGLAASTYQTQQFAQRAEQKYIRLERLGGQVIHLDEVLTMSARMAAATGNIFYADRYDKYVPELDKTIKEIIALSPKAEAAAFAASTDASNQKLVEMETQALTMVRSGNGTRQEALKIVQSSKYDEQKAIYANGEAEFLKGLSARQIAELRVEQQRNQLAMFISLGFLGCSLAVWALLGSSIRGSGGSGKSAAKKPETPLKKAA